MSLLGIGHHNGLDARSNSVVFRRRFSGLVAAVGVLAAAWSLVVVGPSAASPEVDPSDVTDGTILVDQSFQESGTREFGDYEERLEKLQIVAVVTPEGDLDVTERITWNFAGNQKRGIFRYIPTHIRVDPTEVKVQQSIRKSDRDKINDANRTWDRVMDVAWGKVSSLSGAPTATDISTQDQDESAGNVAFGQPASYSVLRIGEESRFITGRHTYDIRYTIKRVVVDGLLQFVAVGTGWDVPVQLIDVSLVVPIKDGAVPICNRSDRSLPCDISYDNGQVKLKAEGTGIEIEVPVAASISSPAPVIQTEHLITDGFTPKGLPGLVGLVGLVSAGLGAVVFGLKGRDRVFASGAALGQRGDQERPRRLGEKLASPVEFEPPEGIRPALIQPARTGESSQRCISAMVVDLAARNVLRIEPVQDEQGGFDYLLHMVGNGNEPLSKTESDLMSVLFGGGEPSVALSALTTRTELSGQMAILRAQLRGEAVQQGWWDENPVSVRGKWRALGFLFLIGGAIATFLIAAVSSYGIAAMGLMVLGIGLLIIAQSMPVRTATGSRIEARLRGFELLFDAGEGDRLKLAERQNLFAEYLPYAMAFGNVEKWVKTFATMGIQPAVPYFGPLAGYGTGYGPGYYPGGWGGGGSFDQAMNDFEQSLDRSIEAGAAAERARVAAERAESSSSSSSGGFSGGSFGGGGSSGGGGGGSW